MMIYGHEFPPAAEQAVRNRIAKGPATLLQLSVVAENAGCHQQAAYRGVDRLMQKLRKSGEAVFDRDARVWRRP